LSVRTSRTVLGHLRTLAAQGLAEVDQDGHWRATDVADDPEATQTTAASAWRAGQAQQAELQERIGAERGEFRTRLDPAARRARWERQRQAALARTAKAALRRQKAWWDGLTPEERDRRRSEHAAAFAALSPAEQARRKDELAVARARAGLTERSRYEAWLSGLAPDDFAARSDERARAFARRPTLVEQAELVDAWCTHRTRWDLPHHRRTTSAPAGAGARAGAGLPERDLLRRPPFADADPAPPGWRQETLLAGTA
jgi:hypothetical protein